MLEEKEVNGWE